MKTNDNKKEPKSLPYNSVHLWELCQKKISWIGNWSNFTFLCRQIFLVLKLGPTESATEEQYGKINSCSHRARGSAANVCSCIVYMPDKLQYEITEVRTIVLAPLYCLSTTWLIRGTMERLRAWNLLTNPMHSARCAYWPLDNKEG